MRNPNISGRFRKQIVPQFPATTKMVPTKEAIARESLLLLKTLVTSSAKGVTWAMPALPFLRRLLESSRSLFRNPALWLVWIVHDVYLYLGKGRTSKCRLLMIVLQLLCFTDRGSGHISSLCGVYEQVLDGIESHALNVNNFRLSTSCPSGSHGPPNSEDYPSILRCDSY